MKKALLVYLEILRLTRSQSSVASPCEFLTYTDLRNILNIKNVTCNSEKLTVNFNDQFYQNACLAGQNFTDVVEKGVFFVQNQLVGQLFCTTSFYRWNTERSLVPSANNQH